jgi:prevent-host-death family protein
MTRMTATEMRDRISDALSRVEYGGERVIVARNKRDVAVLVSMDDLELIRALEDRIDAIEMAAALREAEVKGTSVWDEFKGELGSE